jgi:hypothetical protein
MRILANCGPCVAEFTQLIEKWSRSNCVSLIPESHSAGSLQRPMEFKRVSLMSRSMKCMALLALASCVAFVGCGPSGPGTVPVNGTLTIDGQPADGLMITLAPIDTSLPAATGNVSNGSFELFSGVQGAKGAVPGKYKVVLAVSGPSSQEEAMAKYSGGGAKKVGGGTATPEDSTSLPFAAKYSSSATSDKEVEITSGSNDLTIDVSSK